MIPYLDIDFFTHSGSRALKGTGSRILDSGSWIRIRNTGCNTHNKTYSVGYLRNETPNLMQCILVSYSIYILQCNGIFLYNIISGE